MSTEQDPRYAGYVQRKQAEGKTPEPYEPWFARIERLDAARAEKATHAEPPNPDDQADDDALDHATAAQQMAAIAEQKMALADARMAEAEALMARAQETSAAPPAAEVPSELLEDPKINASSLGDLTHVKAEQPIRRMGPQTLEDFPGETVLHFSCPANRNRVEIMQAGQKVLMNNTVVVLPHRAIEFTEHHYSADLTDQEGRDRAEWLLQCKAYRSGEIILVPNVALRPVPVRTGPRTAGVKPDTINRPSGPLSVTVGSG